MRLPLLVAGLLVLSACDQSDPAPTSEPPSSFEASVSGDATLALSGPSYAASLAAILDPNVPDAAPYVSFQIGMSDYTSGGVSEGGIVFMLDGPVGVGTIELAPQEDTFYRSQATLIVGELRSALRADAAAGTLTITRADSSGVAGTFRFVTEQARESLHDFDPNDPMGGFRSYEVTVEGSFEADLIDYSDRPEGGLPYSVVVPRPLP